MRYHSRLPRCTAADIACVLDRRLSFSPISSISSATLDGYGACSRRPRRTVRGTRDLLPDELSHMGVIVDIAPCYQTVADETGVANVKRALEQGVDVITFTSSSTVQNFLGLLKDIDLAAALKGVKLVYIGPIAAGTGRRLGLEVSAIAQPHTVQGLVKAISDLYMLK